MEWIGNRGVCRQLMAWFGDLARYPSQQMQPHRDGSLTVEFRLSGTEEIKSWILSFGRGAASHRNQAAAECSTDGTAGAQI